MDADVLVRQRCRSTEKLATGAKGDTPEGQLRCGGQVPSSCAQKTVEVFFEEFQSPSAFRFKSRSGLSPAGAARPLALRKGGSGSLRTEAEANHTEEKSYFTAASAGLDFSAPRTTPRPGSSSSTPFGHGHDGDHRKVPNSNLVVGRNNPHVERSRRWHTICI